MISKHFITGQRENCGFSYYIRNCAFEPTSENYLGIEYTLRQIAAAFRCGKPAIISTHRVNFIGSIDPINREMGLRELHSLLKAIVKKWPGCEFMSSGDALEHMRNEN